MGLIYSKIRDNNLFGYKVVNSSCDSGDDDITLNEGTPNIWKTPGPKAKIQNALMSKIAQSLTEEDPRSPSQFIVRTPICLKSEIKTLNDNGMICDTANAIANEKQTQILSPLDPRSPSGNIDRTPFFFNQQTPQECAKTKAKKSNNYIYEDNENKTNELVPIKQLPEKPATHRTPLSCLVNRNNPRAILKEAIKPRFIGYNKESLNDSLDSASGKCKFK